VHLPLTSQLTIKQCIFLCKFLNTTPSKCYMIFLIGVPILQMDVQFDIVVNQIAIVLNVWSIFAKY
jgi:hypothetical protein